MTSQSADGSVTWTQYTSAEDNVRIVNPCDTTLCMSLKLNCCRSTNCNIDVTWSVLAPKDSNPRKAINCRWHHHRGTGEMVLPSIELKPGEEYFLVLKPKRIDSPIMPVQCSWVGLDADKLIMSQKRPLCDIPGYRQQRNFFKMLTDTVKCDGNKIVKRQQLLNYLVQRLQYHHPRVASAMDRSDRGLASSSTASVLLDGQSRASWLSEMGLSIVVECAADLLEDHSKLANLLGAAREGTSFFGSLFEAIGLRTKAIYQWALFPVARFGTLAMWKSLEQQISKDSMNALLQDGVALQEAFIATMVSRRDEIANELQHRGVKRNFTLACRLGASNVVLQEIRDAVKSNRPHDVGEKCYGALVESLDAAQHDTAQIVWEELAVIAFSTPQVWSLLFSSFSEVLAGLKSSRGPARHWLQQHCRNLLQHLPPSMHPQLKACVKHAFPSCHAQDAISCGLLDQRWFADTCNEYFSVIQYINMLMVWAPQIHKVTQSAKAHLTTLIITALEHLVFSDPLRTNSIDNFGRQWPFLKLISDPLAQRAVIVLHELCRRQHTPSAEMISTIMAILSNLRLQVSHCCKIIVTEVLTRCNDLHELRYIEILFPIQVDDKIIHQVASLKELLSLSLRGSPSISNSHVAQITSLTQLQHLDLGGCFNITDDGVSNIASLTQLQHLDLGGCFNITDDGVSNIASLTQLQHLDLGGCNPITNDGVASIVSLKQLQHLNLCGCFLIADAGVESIALLTRLQHLNLNSCFLIADAQLASIALLTHLLRLDLSGCNRITDDGVASIVSLKQLQHLNLSGCFLIADAGVASIVSLKQLQHLDLSGCNRITDAKAATIASVTQLRYLSIGNCYLVANGMVARIALLTQLQHLTLSCCSLITDAGVASIASLTQLQYLDLSWCKRITNDGAASIASLMQLLHLDLNGCSLITDAGVTSIASLTQLQHLDLSWCNLITGAGVEKIASLKQLQHFSLSRCNQIAGAELASIALLTQLQHLDLSGCKRITDAGVASIAPLTHLQHLDLGGCSLITDAGVASIAPLTQLQHLDLSGCNRITDDGVASIASLTQLLHLDLNGCSLMAGAGAKYPTFFPLRIGK